MKARSKTRSVVFPSLVATVTHGAFVISSFLKLTKLKVEHEAAYEAEKDAKRMGKVIQYSSATHRSLLTFVQYRHFVVQAEKTKGKGKAKDDSASRDSMEDDDDLGVGAMSVDRSEEEDEEDEVPKKKKAPVKAKAAPKKVPAKAPKAKAPAKGKGKSKKLVRRLISQPKLA